MSSSKTRWLARSIVVAVCLPGVVIIGAIARSEFVLLRQSRQLRDGDTHQRAAVMDHIGQEQQQAGATLVLQTLRDDQEASVLLAAASAAARLQLVEAADLLQRRADEAESGLIKAELIVWAVCTSQRDLRLRPWLDKHATADDAWTQAAAAAGHLWLGSPEAGETLLDIALNGEEEVAGFAWRHFQSAGAIAAELAGRGDLVKRIHSRPRAASVDQIRSWWTQSVDASFLVDAMIHKASRPHGWRDVDKLLHAREYAAAILLGRELP